MLGYIENPLRVLASIASIVKLVPDMIDRRKAKCKRRSRTK